MSDTAATQPLRVGFVGLGVMGLPIARNMLQDGHFLTVYARTPDKAEPLESVGAVRVDSPGEVAAASDVTFTMVSDNAAVTEVVAGPRGVLSGAAPGSVWIDMSSIAPRVARDLAALAKEKSVRALDIPVSGGEKGAVNRTLALMVGGEEETLEEVRPLLESISAGVTYVGGHGAGQVAKVCNQMIVAGTMCAVAEALVVARKCEVDPSRVREAISGGAASSRILEDHAQRMLQRTFAPGFRVSLIEKDLGIALDTAKSCGAAALATGQAAQLMSALSSVRGEVDASAVVEIFELLGDAEPVGEAAGQGM